MEFLPLVYDHTFLLIYLAYRLLDTQDKPRVLVFYKKESELNHILSYHLTFYIQQHNYYNFFPNLAVVYNYQWELVGFFYTLVQLV